MFRTTRPVLAAAAVLALVASAFAMPPGGTERFRVQGRRSPSRATAPSGSNLLALHQPDSGSYDGDCLKCHADVLSEKSLDPRVPSFHVAMVPYTPGYNPVKGANNQVCVQCHKYVDLELDSSGALRKHVDPQLCALCHGPAGPGPVFYRR